MSLPDSAEYWWDVKGYSYEPRERKPPIHEGFTPCPVCGRKPIIYDNKAYFKALCKESIGKHIDHEISMYGDTLDELRNKWNRLKKENV